LSSFEVFALEWLGWMPSFSTSDLHGC